MKKYSLKKHVAILLAALMAINQISLHLLKIITIVLLYKVKMHLLEVL